MSSIAVKCIEDLEKHLNSMSMVKGKVWHVYSEEELVERTKGISYPCAGVLYDGMRALPEPGATGKMGLSAELVVTVMIMFKQNTKSTVDAKDSAVDFLDGLREKIAKSRSPSMHFWKFQLEAAVDGKAGVLAYIQRWSTPVQLA